MQYDHFSFTIRIHANINCQLKLILHQLLLEIILPNL
jgi:hypothetical protein